MKPRNYFGGFVVLSCLALPAVAFPADSGETFTSHRWTIGGAPSDAAVESRSERAWHVSFDEPAATPLVLDPPLAPLASATEQRPMAFTYSDGYNTRRKIHMIASYVTLPLFITQVVAGQRLYSEGGGTARSIHDAGMAGIIALFTVNTVTGGWNFLEARKDPNGRTRRLVHSLMMFGADLGFVATGALAPDDDDGGGGSNRSLHRGVAITSMGVAAASYVYMFVTR